MTRSLHRRIEKLEEAGPSTEAIRAAIRRYRETGELPHDARLAAVVQRFVDAIAMMKASVPRAPPEESADAQSDAS